MSKDQDWGEWGMQSLIFVVDSEPHNCEYVRKCLEAAEYIVQTFAGEAEYRIESGQPSLLVVGMHSGNSNNFVFPWGFIGTANSRRVPWIVMLDDGSAEQRRMALDAGADACVVRPFAPPELLERVRALLRRSALATIPRSVERSDAAEIMIDSWAMKLVVRGIEVPATALEFRLLEYLAHHRGQVFTRDFLLDAVWGDMRFINPRSVDACIRRIREKIEPDCTRPTMLKTIRGVGYRLDALAEWQSPPSAVCDCPACKTRVSGLHSY